MCGIAGYLGKFEPELLEQMNAAQSHRGPDGSGLWSEGRVGLSHLRLAIIDLTDAGLQPMWDERRKVVISFNGEIYNYRELRRRCEHAGVVFRGESDTEVLVNLLATFGTDCLPWLNGIFAFAAWFPAEQRMIIARDAAGTKPLYWAKTEGGCAFASEIKALRCVPGIDLSLDPLGMASYLSLLYAPGTLTPVKGIRKVLPGTYLEWKEGCEGVTHAFSPKHYAQEVQDFTKRDAIEGCRHYLNQAVRRQLVSDVPLGGFLSGGTDSSAIAHYAIKNLSSPAQYPCFTVGSMGQGFTGGEGFVDDFPYAQSASKAFATSLHVVKLKVKIVDRLDWMVWQLDEPTPDLAPFMAYAICHHAQEQGIKVLLSGAGGDDIFSGYRRHTALTSEALWGWMPQGLRTGLKQISDRVSPSTPPGRRLSKLFRHADQAPAERLASYFLWLREDSFCSILSAEFKVALGLHRPVETLTNSLKGLPEGVSRLNQMLHLDRSFFLTDHNLNYTDKMAMACGVEVRVPFLDNDLVAFTERLPDSLKQHGTQGKYILQAALRGILPDEILDRPKSGFGLPLRQLMHGDLGRRIEELARNGRLDATGVFNGQGVLDLLAADKRGEVDAIYPLLGVLCIESWIRQFTGK